MAKIISVYKPIGLTPLQTLNTLRKLKPELRNQKLTYCGRLDPMAKGLLLVLVNPKEKDKQKLLELDKTYQFKILFGISTDTHDTLGLISKTSKNLPTRKEILKIIPSQIGTKNQSYPTYSSKTVNGKPLFYYARKNLLSTITIPKKKITIKSLKLNFSSEISKNNLQKQIIQSIKLVKGDFRQQEIINSWTNYFSNTSKKTFTVYSLTTNCTSGTYIRSLANKIGLSLNSQGLAFSIKRTSIGPYHLKNAIRLKS